MIFNGGNAERLFHQNISKTAALIIGNIIAHSCNKTNLLLSAMVRDYKTLISIQIVLNLRDRFGRINDLIRRRHCPLKPTTTASSGKTDNLAF